MSTFFVPPECITGKIALITGQDTHHILDVMRLKKGDNITFFDGSGRFYQGKILDTAKKRVKVQIERVRQENPLSDLEVTLVQSLPKKSRMDYIIEKCTELGVHSIVPCQTARTVVKLGRERQSLRKLRWQRLALEAAKQSGRTTIPQVKNLMLWPDVLSDLRDFDLKLIFCLGEKTQKIKDVLRARDDVRRLALFIGPEGDFTPDEVLQAGEAGCIAVSLGRTVLKSDTAAVSVLAMVNYELRS
jgi:16S rRNA (uracil1498-N3)-methyltransferase